MAFARVNPKVPAKPGRVTVHASIGVAPDGSVLPLVATIDFEVLDAAGEVVATRHLDLLPHLTAGQQTALSTLISQLRTKVQQEAV